VTSHRAHHRRLARAASAAALAAALAGCSSGTPGTTSPASTRHDADDVAFAQQMVVHHRAAVEMAELAAERAASPEVRDLADRVLATQEPEIQTMTSWLQAWGAKIPADAPMDHDAHGEGHDAAEMPGMMSSEQMADLEAASGAAFDEIWLTGMVAHHEGAVAMARTEQQEGADPDAVALAERIEADQSAEVAEMTELLGDAASTSGEPLPSSHVHGVAADPADGTVVLATHDGLFRSEGGSWTRVGPVIDLMGFAVAGPDHYYASGHPGPGTDLPEPVGLLESTDGGRTWTPLSRQGESDFHAMAASEGAVVGFDGTLRRTSDGVAWTPVEAPVEPYALAASGRAATVVATSPRGPALSTDAGETWSTLPDAPLLLLAAVADERTIVGATPDGEVVVSEDTGATWQVRGTLGATPQALSAARGEDGALQVLAVTEHLLVSTDGGATFARR